MLNNNTNFSSTVYATASAAPVSRLLFLALIFVFGSAGGQTSAPVMAVQDSIGLREYLASVEIENGTRYFYRLEDIQNATVPSDTEVELVDMLRPLGLTPFEYAPGLVMILRMEDAENLVSKQSVTSRARSQSPAERRSLDRIQAFSTLTGESLLEGVL